MHSFFKLRAFKYITAIYVFSQPLHLVAFLNPIVNKIKIKINHRNIFFDYDWNSFGHLNEKLS